MNEVQARLLAKKHARRYCAGDDRYEPAMWLLDALREAFTLGIRHQHTKRTIAKIHDGRGNVAEIEDDGDGKQFVRLVRIGVSHNEIVRAESNGNVVYGMHETHREPDIAYGCRTGTPSEINEYLIINGFPPHQQ